MLGVKQHFTGSHPFNPAGAGLRGPVDKTLRSRLPIRASPKNPISATIERGSAPAEREMSFLRPRSRGRIHLMNQPDKLAELEQGYAFPGPNDPPREWGREEAAYAREQERLLRDHLGKFVVIHHDEIAGIYDTADDAIFEAYKRFGFVPLIVKEIRPEEPADFVSLVDLNHPSLKRVN